MSLKNIAKKIVLSGVLLMATINGAFAANEGLCQLIDKLKGVFQTLRVLAFVGAAFVLAAWAWQWIYAGTIDIKDDVRKKGVAMLVGLGVLFVIGILLSVLLNGNVVGCANLTTQW